MKSQVIFDRAQIQQCVVELAVQISRDYRGQDVVLVGLLKGCVPFISDLGAQLEFIKESGEGVGDVYLDYMMISSYHDKHEPGALRLERDIEFPVKGVLSHLPAEPVVVGKPLEGANHLVSKMCYQPKSSCVPSSY